METGCVYTFFGCTWESTNTSKVPTGKYCPEKRARRVNLMVNGTYWMDWTSKASRATQQIPKRDLESRAFTQRQGRTDRPVQQHILHRLGLKAFRGCPYPWYTGWTGRTGSSGSTSYTGAWWALDRLGQMTVRTGSSGSTG